MTSKEEDRAWDFLADSKAEAMPEVPDLPRYEIRKRVGEGAAAIVFKAWDRELRRVVALKVLRHEVGVREGVRERFQREARISAGLSHPGIVTVHDAGEKDGLFYIVTEFVEGRPLSEIIGERKYESSWIVELLSKVARGVGSAHEKRVIHRDIKPANILVSPEGEPKLGDFGVAHVIGSETGLTRTGAAVGTPVYMSPEQVKGDTSKISPASDVYGLGAVLYEAVTGRPPHLGESVVEIYGKILHDEPLRPERFGASIPRDLEFILMKALEKDGSRRYRNGSDLADDLDRHLTGKTVHASGRGPIRTSTDWVRRHPVQILATLIVLIVAAWYVIGQAQLENERRIRREQDLAQAAKLRGKGVECETDFGKTREQITGLQGRVHEAWRDLKRWDLPEKKKVLWKLQRSLDEQKQRVRDLESRTISLYTQAMQYPDPAGETKKRLIAFLKLRLLEAERREDRDRRSLYTESLRRLGQDEWLGMGGTLTIDTTPTTAQVFIYKFVEAEDRRLLPASYNIKEGTLRPQRRPDVLDFSEFNMLGTTPIRSIDLPRGSYLLIIRKSGRHDTRYPLRIDRGTEHHATVNLYTPTEVGNRFVYIPGGSFIMGGDPDAHYSSGRDMDVYVDDFMISYFEVTSAQFLQFLNDRDFHTVDEARRFAPVSNTQKYLWVERGQEFLLPEGWHIGIPVFGVSWDSANEFCIWLTTKAKEFNDPVTFRLPTNVEWEKAARGVDGRFFPWGNHFDWTFTKGHYSRKGKSQPELIGAFEGDASPYGVRDMAGSMREWCQDWFDEHEVYRYARGGAWPDPADFNFRCATRGWFAPGNRMNDVGIRIVRIPTK